MGKQYNDQDIDQLLRKLPKSTDTRNKSDIYNKLIQDKRLQQKPRKHIKQKYIAAITTIAAIFIMSLVTYKLIATTQQEDSVGDMQQATESMDQSTNKYSIESNEQLPTEADESSVTMEAKESESTSSLVSAEELSGYVPFPLGVTINALAIPITWLIPKEKVMEDFGTVDVTNFQLYERYAAEFNEGTYGFDEYQPYDGKLMEQNDSIVHTLPADHKYDMGTASETVYFQTMNYTFPNYDNLATQMENGEAAEFSHIGSVENTKLLHGMYQRGIFLYVMEDGTRFFFPEGEVFESVADAINSPNGMRQKINDLVQSVLPASIDFDITESESTVQVTFANQEEVNALDRQTLTTMMDGLIYTASNFGKSITFKNLPFEEWAGFRVGEEIPPVAGYNKIRQ
ncbi:hypothetical protein [Paenisporosarcina cavernae]|uniref:Uncharacterized protein n=1 Tax=Paenisporosarcina cavernae TaxID=2320858 RepID=A0A385YSS8_9BACL|nr:hypothetical protein [Paenisporosarcina cavernae]AYC29360.1 hypothetical protein D3873_05485 [Paenisporosarcina cavernae]